MVYFQIFVLITLALWIDREGRRREKELKQKYDNTFTKLVNTQNTLKLTLDTLQKHYPEIYANDFYYMRDSLETNKDWFI